VPPDFAAPFRPGEPANAEGIVWDVKNVSPVPNPLSSEVWEESQGLRAVPAPDTEVTLSPPLPAANLYRLLVGILSAVVVAWVSLSAPAGINALPYGLLVALMVLPGVQLGASALGGILVVLFYADKDAGLARIGPITLWSLVGTAAGFAAMAGCCVMFRR
jgi:hypothetical protein